jgi:molybdopterin-containing oxidoreductase family iron-sulfur binding subunit
LIDRFCRQLDIERLPECELFSYGAIREANRILFGEARVPDYSLDEADFLLTLGADIFETFGSPVMNANRFGKRGHSNHTAWYHLEPHITLSGLQADRRLTVRPGSEPVLLLYLLKRLPAVESGWPQLLPGVSLDAAAAMTGLPSEDIADISDRLQRAANPLVISGGVSTGCETGLETAILTALLQWKEGMTGRTVGFSRSQEYGTVGTFNDMKDLCRRLQDGSIGILFISKTDPLMFCSGICNLSEDMRKASLRVGLSNLMNDTMRACDVVLPLSHSLESWGDSRPQRHLLTLMQPAIHPLFDTRTEGDILLDLLRHAGQEETGRTYQKLLFETWARDLGAARVEEFIGKGYIETSETELRVILNENAARDIAKQITLPDPAQNTTLVVSPSLRFFDGRSAGLPLMNEIPDPLATVSYGRWVAVSYADAERAGLRDKDEVKVSAGTWTERLPVAIQPGLPSGVIMVQQGLPAIPLHADERSGEAVRLFQNVLVERTGKTILIPVLSGSTSQEGRGVIPHKDEHHHHPQGEHSNYPEAEYPDYRWAMAIDLDRCLGCSACVAACYIENNIPLVGPSEHLKGREMSWLRLEPYFDAGSGTADRHSTHFLPMMCQHCDYAPCEPVCPVYATYHNPEGLNAQVYNRCVGTRYCSNNCPYKVRRFNWFDHEREAQLDSIRNPDVSKRGRGLMEKCTFCVQRIRKAKDAAKDEKRKVQDGEVVPACAQTCPTRAIVFGNLLDSSSTVYQWAHSPRAMRLFDHLGTGPGVYYLSRKGSKHEA